MARASDALALARTLLNDDGQLVWHDSVLMPKLRQAHLEMVQKYALNGIPVLRDKTVAILVLAGAVDLGINLPTNIVEPSKMEEIIPGDDIANTIPMTEVDYIPNLDQTENLRYWAWENEAIKFLGATQDRVVHLYYMGSLATPVAINDPLGINMSESFLGPRVASLALNSIRDFASAKEKAAIADAAIDKLIRIQVKGQQNLPVRRRPFSYQNRRRLAI